MFLTMMGEHLYDFDAEAELLEAFECFDEGDTGLVKGEEMRKWLGDVGERMGDKEVGVPPFLFFFGSPFFETCSEVACVLIMWFLVDDVDFGGLEDGEVVVDDGEGGDEVNGLTKLNGLLKSPISRLRLKFSVASAERKRPEIMSAKHCKSVLSCVVRGL